MVRGRLAAAIGLLVVLAPVVIAQTSDVSPDAPAPCVPRQEATDPAGDVEGVAPGLPPPTDLTPMDLLGVAMWREEEGLGLSGTLAADPRDAGDARFYYWLSFEAETPAAGGNPATWTFQRTSTYDLIRTMYWETDVDVEYPVTWVGATFSFLLPWEDLEAQYGNDWPMDIGSPSLSSSGPYYVNDEPTGYGNYATGLAGWNDWVEYDRELVPLPDCASSAEPTSAEAGDSSPPATLASSDSPGPAGEQATPPETKDAKDVPALRGLAVAFAALALALTRRR